MNAQHASRAADSGVSSVVGTVLMLGVTITVFAGLSLTVLQSLDQDDGPPLAELVIDRQELLVLEHRGGEPIDLATGKLVVNEYGVKTTWPLKDLAAQTADGQRLLIGETLCIYGAAAGCHSSAPEVLGVALIVNNRIIALEGDLDLVPVAQPDLAPGPITFAPDPLFKDVPATFQSTITNHGDLATSGSIQVRFYVDNVYLGDHIEGGPIAPLGTFVATSPTWPGGSSGMHTVRVVVDEPGVHAESDETNNERTKLFPVDPLPDLLPGPPSWVPDPIRKGEAATFSSLITNAGAKDAAAPFQVSFYVDGVLLGHVVRNDPLAPGASFVATSPSWGGGNTGSHTIRVVADSLTQVLETDETNNEVMVTFNVVGVPDLKPNPATVSPQPLQKFKSATFQATIANQGDGASSGPIQVKFYVNGAFLSSYVHNPSLPPLGTFVATSSVWPGAAAGTYPVRVVVDEGNAHYESDETNNEAITTFTVVNAVPDPGHAFEDKNGDLLYDPDVDGPPIPNADVKDGLFQSANHGLVIPATVGSITAPEIEFIAKKDLVVQVHVTASASNKGLTLQAEGGQLVATGGGSTQKAALFEATADINLAASTWQADEFEIISSTGGIIATDTTMTTPPSSGLTMEADKAIVLTRANLQVHSKMVITSDSQGISAQDAILRSNNDLIQLTAHGDIDLQRAITTSKKATTIESQQQHIDVRNAQMTTIGNTNLVLKVSSVAKEVRVQGAAFDDANDKADVVPNGSAVGTPASGGVE